MTTGRVHSLESFGSADGPGLRYVVFLNGCKLRCRYCHNPDTWARTDFQTLTPAEVLEKALRCRPYWSDGGGLTVSGGEPLLQLDFVLELFRLAKAQGVNTCLDTAAGPFTRDEPWFSGFNALMDVTDLVLLDLKQFDGVAHRQLTGQDNANILDCARWLSERNVSVWIRHVLVPGVTDDAEDLAKLAAFIRGLRNVRRVEVLPYHTLGVYKWKALGLPYPLDGVSPPTSAQIETARRILGA